MLALFPLMTLLTDASRVVEIRLRMMVCGRSTPSENMLMVTEKLDALEEASAILASGGSPLRVIENYQKIVSANVARLSDCRVTQKQFN